MENRDSLTSQFEQNRSHLRSVAYRMLGSLAEADDAVQEAWLRLHRTDASTVDNLGGWLTTVVARICLDALRSRKSRREDSLDATPIHPDEAAKKIPEPTATHTPDPETEVILADSVGIALLVVLDTLPPAERLAFVLHDMFDLSFDEIAPIVDRTPTAARQLASRARRRVQGKPAMPEPNFNRQRKVVEAFIAASQRGDFEALLTLLDPNVILRADPAAFPAGLSTELRTAEAVANQAARARARWAQPALVDGAVGVIVAPRGRLLMVIRFTVIDNKITAMEAIANPERLHQLNLATLSN